jgi:5-methylcytosine-specific restriction endonuclease McrA
MIQRKKPTRKRSKTTKAKLIAKLDAVFSEFIRLRDAAEWHKEHPESGFGYVACCTCGKVDYWKNMDAGHYVSRDEKNTRYEEWNVNTQCSACNRFHSGRISRYVLFIAKKYGEHVPEQLDAASRIVKHWLPVELEALIVHYTQEVKKAKAQYGCGGTEIR